MHVLDRRTGIATAPALLLAVLLPIAMAAHAQAPAPVLLVLEKGAGSLAIVDPGQLQVVSRVEAGDDPHEIVASADGRFAYISNYGASSPAPGHTLSVVDLVGRRAVPAVDLGALRAPHGLEMANGRVYFTAEGSRVIGRYDPPSQRVDWILGIGQDRTHMLVVARGMERIVTSNMGSDTITILEPAKGRGSEWTATHVAVGRGPEGLDLSPDGKELWAANSQDGTLSIVDVAARKVIQSLQVNTKRSNRLKFTPDGKRVLVSDLGSGDLLVLDAASRKELKRVNLGRGVSGILVAPDGSRAFVAVSPDDSVAAVDLVSLSVIGRIATGKGPDGMAWTVTE